MITHKQLTLAEVFEDCQHKFDNDKYHFLALLDEAINLDEIVPVSFVSHFHAQTGRPRKHQLYPMLKALLLQRIFSIPTDTLLIVFLKYSQELRDFCGFDVVPDGSKFTRFKQDFLSDLQSMFDHLVDLTEPICQKLNPALADIPTAFLIRIATLFRNYLSCCNPVVILLGSCYRAAPYLALPCSRA